MSIFEKMHKQKAGDTVLHSLLHAICPEIYTIFQICSFIAKNQCKGQGKAMRFFIPIDQPLEYRLTGKFRAPTEDWMHLERIMLDFELMVMTEGVLYIQIDGEKYELKKNDYLICPPGSAQQGYKKGYASFYWLHFAVCEWHRDSDYASEPDPELLMGINSTGTLGDNSKMVVMMKQMQDAVRAYDSRVYNNYLASGIMLELFNACRLHESRGSGPAQLQLYNDIIDYIKWNKDKNLKVTDVAGEFKYNPKYLSHLFSRVVGVTLKQYIIQEQVERAKFLLTDSNEKIISIAQQMGFSDSHNFMKLFKKQVGMTPSQYREAYNKRMMFYI